MKELEYPFDSNYILGKRRFLKKQLLKNDIKRISKRIAVLGGSTTHDLVQILEIFLLDQGIAPIFYESEYSQYWMDVMYENMELKNFAPDLIYIHTTNKNISDLEYPDITDTKEQVEEKLQNKFNHFSSMWAKLEKDYHCPVIQNNMDYPYYRLLGNKDCSDIHGRINFINKLNGLFTEYISMHDNLYVQDINWLSSCIGMYTWQNPFYWHMYKCSPAIPAIPELAFNLSNIIKAIYGKNKKSLILDLDNTLWGGVIGEDGVDNIEIGQETNIGQIYTEFQSYIKAHKKLGVMLNINSKNDQINAYAGLNRPDTVLKPEDFVIIKANWESKDINTQNIAQELNIGEDAFVFIDDNPAERHIVKNQLPLVAVPEITNSQNCCPEEYIRIIDRSGYFECINISNDDIKRTEMYKDNAKRAKYEATYSDYSEYLKSLEMNAEIKPFSSVYISRIAQLTNKSNQFNLTTKRFSQADIELISRSNEYIKLYGKLNDRFGDNGIVSVVLGHIGEPDISQSYLLKACDNLNCLEQSEFVFHIDLWLMSCRVLKRTMESAMMDELVNKCIDKNIKIIFGYYYPTAKNLMVENFYSIMGFTKLFTAQNGEAVWIMYTNMYESQNKLIHVIS